MKKKVHLFKYSTVKIGSKNQWVYFPENREEIIESVKDLKICNDRIYIIGGCSNILFDELSVSQKAIISTSKINDYSFATDFSVKFGSGIFSSFVSCVMYFMGIEGYEFLHLLPGSLGGAVFMNARCYEGEISTLPLKIESIDFKDPDNINIVIRKAEECLFEYKHSIFQKNGELVSSVQFTVPPSKEMENTVVKRFNIIKSILEKSEWKKIRGNPSKLADLKKFYAFFSLKNIDHILSFLYKKCDKEGRDLLFSDLMVTRREKIRERMNHIEEDRKKKHHFSYPSLGSVFKNNYRAGEPMGKIIDKLGLRGYEINGISISPYHGNIFINRGKGKSEDFRKIIKLVREKVYREKGFFPETEIISFFNGDSSGNKE